MSTTPEIDPPAEIQRAPKASTIGAVCKALSAEFPDISISKIRYLEDQKLLSPRRTPGGYRLYTPSDVARLRTILRLQRDEFLPLRVIRQELVSGSPETAEPTAGPADVRRRWRSNVSVTETSSFFSLEDVLEETRADAKLVAELEEYGVIKGETRSGRRFYDDTEREIIRAVTELARYGVGGRNLRVFRSSADREANLLQQILAPRCARATRSGARRQSRRSRTSRPSRRTSSTCCSCATCARSPIRGWLMTSRVRPASAGSSGARTQGGGNGSAIAPTEDDAAATIRARRTCARGYEPAS